MRTVSVPIGRPPLSLQLGDAGVTVQFCRLRRVAKRGSSPSKQPFDILLRQGLYFPSFTF
jgi:hypothetical protein